MFGIRNFLFLILGLFITDSSWSCVGCGQSESFTPKILLAGTGFVILPLAFAGFIAWRLWQDYKHSQKDKT